MPPTASRVGFSTGLEGAGSVPVVGVERSDSDPSSIGFYDSEGLRATVDSIDLVSGRVALAYALNGVGGQLRGQGLGRPPAAGPRRPPAPTVGHSFR